jgi:hypothetical protein
VRFACLTHLPGLLDFEPRDLIIAPCIKPIEQFGIEETGAA